MGPMPTPAGAPIAGAPIAGAPVAGDPEPGALSLLIVVVHYRGLDDTLECLDSLARQRDRAVHTLVVDNGSADDLAARLGVAHPWAEVVRAEENLGWSGANNVGIRLALERNFDAVCLLNNDTVVQPDTAGRLMQTMRTLGACLLHPAIDSYDPAPGPQLDPATGDMPAKPVPGLPGVYDIGTVDGSCMLVHLDVVRRIGLIDDRFFLLCEDADYWHRALDAGFNSYCDTGTRILHKESRAFGGRRTPVKTYYSMRNLLLYHEKHQSWWRFPRIFVRQIAWGVAGAARASGQTSDDGWAMLRWSLSSAPFARAVRLGIKDYVLRRFGRLKRAL